MNMKQLIAAGKLAYSKMDEGDKYKAALLDRKLKELYFEAFLANLIGDLKRLEELAKAEIKIAAQAHCLGEKYPISQEEFLTLVMEDDDAFGQTATAH